jgi:hypothetical protein
MTEHTYLVFGDLHGRILPAFHLALAWQRDHGERLAAMLQVGDLGFFPDVSRLDKATKRHADRDPLELGAQLIAIRSREADAVFAAEDLPEALWFTPGNHEDYTSLDDLAHSSGCTHDDFPVDYYQRVRCIRDGHIVNLPGGLRVGALWGIDDQAPNARRKVPQRGRISQRSATQLSYESFDVLLTHDSPRDAVFVNSGSDAITSVIELARPSFAFFGHYHGEGRLAECAFAPTKVFHLHGLELRERGGCAESNSVGVLRWDGKGGRFAYVDPSWLRSFTRHNWKHR